MVPPPRDERHVIAGSEECLTTRIETGREPSAMLPADFKRLLFDLDGVCYLRGTPIAGVADAIAAVETAGASVVYVTNNSHDMRTGFAERLASAGIRADPDQIVTSSIAAAELLGMPGPSGVAPLNVDDQVAVMGGPGISQAVADAGYGAIDVEAAAMKSGQRATKALVVGIDLSLSYGRLASAARIVRGGSRFIATNTDSTFPTETGLEPGAGSLVAAVAVASGIDPEPEIAGKPEEGLAIAVRRIIGAGPAMMIGDRIETDIEFATRWGFASALVLSGVAIVDDLARATVLPEFVAADVAELFANPVSIDPGDNDNFVASGGEPGLRRAVSEALPVRSGASR